MYGERKLNSPVIEVQEVHAPPSLLIRRLGIVSRDYNHRFGNGLRDFSGSLAEILNMLDEQKCDTVLFSLFSIISEGSIDVSSVLQRGNFQHVKIVMLEYFFDGAKRSRDNFYVYHDPANRWLEYRLNQKFGTLREKIDLNKFVVEDVPKRVMGNCCVLLCGEINGVPYVRRTGRVEDTFGLRRALPANVTVILNPVHDRMTRFEMNLKRKFLSEKGRCLISIWNKGKEDKRGRTRDGRKPPWIAFRNGVEIEIERTGPLAAAPTVEIGILDLATT